MINKRFETNSFLFSQVFKFVNMSMLLDEIKKIVVHQSTKRLFDFEWLQAVESDWKRTREFINDTQVELFHFMEVDDILIQKWLIEINTNFNSFEI